MSDMKLSMMEYMLRHAKTPDQKREVLRRFGLLPRGDRACYRKPEEVSP